MAMDRHVFSRNLKFACGQRKSISEVCRAIGLNRQQFNRYVNQGALPSAHNLGRIAAYFGIEPMDFALPLEGFRQRIATPLEPLEPEEWLFKDGFPGNLTELRRHLGFYQTYHLSLSWPGKIVCSCVRLSERRNRVHVKSIERISDPGDGIRQFSKYTGLATFLRGRIFVVERTVGEHSLIAQTILSPFAEHQRTFLKGVTMGVSWRHHNLPYSSRMIWQYLGTGPDLRTMLGRCSTIDPRYQNIPNTVRNYLLDPEGPHEPLASE